MDPKAVAGKIVDALAYGGVIPHQCLDGGRSEVEGIVSYVLDREMRCTDIELMRQQRDELDSKIQVLLIQQWEEDRGGDGR